MKLDVVAYFAAQRARLASARAVHLHPTQLAPPVIDAIRAEGVDVHAWEANDEASLQAAATLEIPRICTDQSRKALAFCQRLT